MAVSLCLAVLDATSLVQLLHEGGPFAAKNVGTGEGAITAADGKAVDTKFDEVFGGLQTTFPGADYMSATVVACGS